MWWTSAVTPLLEKLYLDGQPEQVMSSIAATSTGWTVRGSAKRHAGEPDPSHPALGGTGYPENDEFQVS